MRKKLLSVLLSVAVAATMIPAAGLVAFADTTDGYGLYVGGVEVTAENKADILSDGGSASYDPETQQLTLTDATISYDKPEVAESGEPDIQGAIDSAKDLAIVLKGKNEIVSNNAEGIVNEGNLTFKSGEKSASLQVTGYDLAIDATGKVDNSADVSATGGEGVACKQFVNSGDLSIKPMEGYTGLGGITAEESFENTGNVTISDMSCAVQTQEFNQKSGSVTVGDKFGMGIYCLKYNQLGGTVDLTSDVNISSILGILMEGESASAFNIAGGKLNITINSEDCDNKIGIAALCSSFKISGGSININVAKGVGSAGIEVIGTTPEISGGTVDITVDGLPTGQEDYMGYLTFGCAEDTSATLPSGPILDGMKVTVSNNVDGSDPVAYDPSKVADGYKYMHIEKPVELKSLSLSKTSYYCTGKSQGPSLTVKDVNGKTVSSANYTVSGTKKATKPGTYKVTVKGKGKYTGTCSKSYTIKVKPAKIASLAKGKKSFTVKASKLTSTYSSGYQVRYSLKKSMSKAKTATISSKSSAVKKTVKKLKKGKTYYVQIRNVKKIGSKKYYSAWSAKNTVKTK